MFIYSFFGISSKFRRQRRSIFVVRILPTLLLTWGFWSFAKWIIKIFSWLRVNFQMVDFLLFGLRITEKGRVCAVVAVPQSIRTILVEDRFLLFIHYPFPWFLIYLLELETNIMFWRREISNPVFVSVFIQGPIFFKFLLISPIILNKGLFPEERVYWFVGVEGWRELVLRLRWGHMRGINPSSKGKWRLSHKI